MERKLTEAWSRLQTSWQSTERLKWLTVFGNTTVPNQ